ncbi:MAG: threonine synthase [Chloroflexi bacterium HGW-Chloroflexi-6]|nr:MAG: threonine synthase [Chloroflexi bacterium HGW-Chloroflexi-6]
MITSPKSGTDFSYISHLACSDCGKVYSASELNTYCLDCQSPLLAHYDLDGLRKSLRREDFATRPWGMWRWHELLPVRAASHCITLGEGDAPLLRLPKIGEKLGLTNLFLKDESGNPTGSFKARGIAVAISKARELGVRRVIIPTAGNAGGAMAAYAARAGLKAHIFMPKDTPVANVQESRMAGAEVVLVDGLISEAAGMAGEKARAEGWFDLSTFKEPYRVEGKKTMGYELAEAFGWTLPDVIIYPAGGGTGLVGLWKAFAELEALGWLENAQRPRLVAVQAKGCAPLVKAFKAGASFCDFWINAHTIAAGLRVPKSFADHLILRDLYESQGTAVSVSDEAILAAQHQMGEDEGVFAAPEGAATLAALIKLKQLKWVKPDERIVLFNTGSGLKYLS